MKLESLNIAGSPVPLLGSEKAAWADSHIMCINKNIKDKKLIAAWKFVKFLSDNSLEWALGGQIPARTSLLKSKRFSEMKIQSEFARQLPYIRYMPRVAFIGEFCSELDIAAEKALRGSLSAKESLDIAAQRVNKVIKRYNQTTQWDMDE
jgi:multiple sugar transport system substrate-binding protein